MRRRPFVFMAIMLLALMAAAAVSGQEDATNPPVVVERGSLFKIGRSVQIAADERAENIISIGGRVEVLGNVRESVIVLGGSVNVMGRIGEDLVVFGGDVILEDGSYVGGDLVLNGGELHRSAAAQVMGRIKEEEYWPENWEQIGRQTGRYIGVPDGPGFFVGLIAMLLFGLLLAYLVPRQIEAQVAAVQREPLRMLGFGVLAVLLFVPLVVMLAITILGIPLIPVVVLAYGLAALAGVVSCAMIVGLEVSRHVQTEPMSALLMVALGITVLAVLRLIPVIGELLTLLIWLTGFGVALATRFGTHPLAAWQEPAPPP